LAFYYHTHTAAPGEGSAIAHKRYREDASVLFYLLTASALHSL